MRSYLDENVPIDVLRIGRSLGLDIESSHEAGNDALTDPRQLDCAAAQGRCLITINRDDFIRLTNEFASTDRAHAGVLIISHGNSQHAPRRVVEAIMRYVERRGSAPADYLCDFLRA